MIRINKFLSLCGVSSRRGAETLILEKRVKINDEIVSQLGTLVDSEKDIVSVDGKVVTPAEKKLYVLLNKPQKVMTTMSDPFKRKTILHFVKDIPIRVYPVGRLDYDTEGVLLMTNDGELAFQLTHPKFQVQKIYEAIVTGEFTDSAADKIAEGVKLEDGAIGHGDVKILNRSDDKSKIHIILTEGRKREVRQLCKIVGHPVTYLKRIKFAGITANGLQLGKWRYLTSNEIEQLKKLVSKEHSNS